MYMTKTLNDIANYSVLATLSLSTHYNINSDCITACINILEKSIYISSFILSLNISLLITSCIYLISICIYDLILLIIKNLR